MTAMSGAFPKGGTKPRSFWVPQPSPLQIELAQTLADTMNKDGRASRSATKETVVLLDTDSDTEPETPKSDTGFAKSQKPKRKAVSNKSADCTPLSSSAKKHKVKEEHSSLSTPSSVTTAATGAVMRSSFLVNDVINSAIMSMRVVRAMMSAAAATPGVTSLLVEIDNAIQSLTEEKKRLHEKIINPFIGSDE